jgi:hypothetical protein
MMMALIITIVISLMRMLCASNKLLCWSKFITVPSWWNSYLKLLQGYILVSYLNVMMSERATSIWSQIIVRHTTVRVSGFVWVMHWVWSLILLVWSCKLDVGSETVRGLVAWNHSSMPLVATIGIMSVLVWCMVDLVLSVSLWECWMTSTWESRMCF